jgi:cation diffusion facilitator CzcD-associated flavoprotein CzcO
VFQRSAAYVLPKPDKLYSRLELSLFKNFPAVLKLSRLRMYLQHEARAVAFVTWRAALKVKRGTFFRHLKRGVGDAKLRHQRLIRHTFQLCSGILPAADAAIERAARFIALALAR